MQVFHYSCFAMGTRFNLVLGARDDAYNEALSSEVARILKDEESTMSCFLEESEVSVINRKAARSAVKVSDKLAKIFDACQYYFQATDGAFDVGMLHLTRLLRAGKLGRYEAIENDGLGWKRVVWNAGAKEIKFRSPLTGIDLGGFGKGWAMEKVRKFLLAKGVEMAFISFGESTVATIGTHPLGDCWPLTIRHPVSEVCMLIELNDNALSVSCLKDMGDACLRDGIPHIISPLNQQAVKNDQLIVVKAQSPLTAEVLSTAVVAANEHQRAAIFENFSDVSIYKCVGEESVFNRLL